MCTLRAKTKIFAFVALLVWAAPAAADGPNLGQPISEADLAPWDLTVMPDGSGLPLGSGTPAQGKALFAANCAICHGDNGKGGIAEAVVVDDPPPLSGPGSVKSIGNFWPASTSIFDFIRRAMPFTQPRSLSTDQVYALTAYLLYMNKVIGESEVMDAKTLPQVKMPNRDNFFPEFPKLMPRQAGDPTRR
jgi:S-disulfanyl-L-cysteine oxidoreductase SoxD